MNEEFRLIGVDASDGIGERFGAIFSRVGTSPYFLEKDLRTGLACCGVSAGDSDALFNSARSSLLHQRLADASSLELRTAALPGKKPEALSPSVADLLLAATPTIALEIASVPPAATLLVMAGISISASRSSKPHLSVPAAEIAADVTHDLTIDLSVNHDNFFAS